MCMFEKEERYYVENAKEFIESYFENLLTSVEISQHYPFIAYDIMVISEILSKNRSKINKDISNLELFANIVGQILVDKLNTFEGK